MGTKVRSLLACGAIGCPIFVLVFLVEGVTRTGYNPLRHPVSSLSIGDYGWMQVANFIITGSLLLAFAVGLRRKLRASAGGVWGALLMGVVAVGLVGAGIFSTDPVYGYPPDKPFLAEQVSIHGHLHILFSIPVFLCLPSACFVFRRRFIAAGERGWATYSYATGIAMFVLFVFAAMGFNQLPGFVAVGGLFQRLCIITGWTWITLLAVHLIRQEP